MEIEKYWNWPLREQFSGVSQLPVSRQLIVPFPSYPLSQTREAIDPNVVASKCNLPLVTFNGDPQSEKCEKWLNWIVTFKNYISTLNISGKEVNIQLHCNNRFFFVFFSKGDINRHSFIHLNLYLKCYINTSKGIQESLSGFKNDECHQFF
jgi:hypothetical protein